MKYVLPYLLGIIVCLTPYLLIGGEPDKELETKCVRPTVLVFDEASGSYGSGAIVRSQKMESGLWLNVVVTCKHVSEMLELPMIGVMNYSDWSELGEPEGYFATVIATHKTEDIALILFISNKEMPTAELGFDEEIYLGNEVLMVGCAFRDSPRLEYGRVTGKFDNSYRMQMIAIPGDSGGPVYHNNKIVSIKVAFKLKEIQGKTYPIFSVSNDLSIKVLKDWAKEVNAANIFKEDVAAPQLPVMMLQARSFRQIVEFPF